MLERLALPLAQEWRIPDFLIALASKAEKETGPQEEAFRSLGEENFLKVLRAFREAEIREIHLHDSHGYGYFDSGRQALENLFARIFGGEEALVRAQIVSGTHALRCALFGLLRPGDEVLLIPEIPYDTLHPLFGLRAAEGSLAEWGISLRGADPEALLSGKTKLGPRTRVVFLQRSKGYAWRPSLPISVIRELIQTVKSQRDEVWVIVDNCYGEFVEREEPCHAGADLAVGSLIKNPGGGLATTGGYLVGSREAVRKAAAAFSAPGLGKEVGPQLGLSRQFFTGILLAPLLVAQALCTAEFASRLFQGLGYPVLPVPGEKRTDTIQAIRLGGREEVLAFARGLQEAGPLDHLTIPLPAPMAGYGEEIVMAGGTLVQGGSLELSCDAPLVPPYAVFVQGGMSSVHGKLGLLLAAREVAGGRTLGPSMEYRSVP